MRRLLLLLLPLLLPCHGLVREGKQRVVVKERAKSNAISPSITALDRDEALLFAALLRGGFHLSRSVMRAMEDCLRTLVNTFYGLVSAPLRLAGSGLRLVSQTVLRVCLRLTRPKSPAERMPHVFDNLLRLVGRWLHKVAGVGVAVSEGMVLIADTIELLGTHFDAATADSFRILDSSLTFVEKSISSILLVGPMMKKPNETHRNVNVVSSKKPVQRSSRTLIKNRFTGNRPGIPVHIGPRLISTARQVPVPLNFTHESEQQSEERQQEEKPGRGSDSFNDILTWMRGIFLERFHYSPPLLLPILLVLMIVCFSFANKSKRSWLINLLVVSLAWLALLEINHHQTLRLLQRQKTEAVVSYITSLTHSSDGNADFEPSIWLNALFSSLWGVDKGGLGAYVSDLLKSSLDAQLALVPAGLAKIDLKSFSLGGRAPTIKGVRVFRNKAVVCIAGGSGCNNLVLQLDLAYLSHDMDIALTL